MDIICQIQLLEAQSRKENSDEKQKDWGLKEKEGPHAKWDDVGVSFSLPTPPRKKPKSIFGKIVFINWAVNVLPLLYYIIL